MGSDTVGALTQREAQCMKLVLELHTNDAIARELNLSTNTVKNHVKSARDKLGGLGRYDAARRYRQIMAESDDTGPSGTSPESTMAPHRPIEFVEDAVRHSDGPGEATFFEARAQFAYDEPILEITRSQPRDSPPDDHVLPFRLVAVLAGAVLIALLIVATPPMAASFGQLARVVTPLFR